MIWSSVAQDIPNLVNKGHDGKTDQHHRRLDFGFHPYPYEDYKHYVMTIPPRDLFSTSEDADSESSQPFYGEHDEHSTSPAIPSDDGELVLERIGLTPTVIEVVPERIIAQEHEADFMEDSKSDESS
ncbi:hypothetical protein PIB30_011774 [Stylosanthes scabra]|uniref:Uncharacterized protein n=1 Tax=Stylosanthes scabra TaxID=79078 RepID=A0ABU6Q5W3_9FABA|nr:hypothetical protein [Stylosanthes scabra]